MVTSGKIEEILYEAILSNPVLGILPEIETGQLALITEDNNHERISIRCPASDNEDWQHSFAYVHIYVPDIKVKKVYRKDGNRLNALESAVRNLFKCRTFDRSTNETIYYQMDDLTKEPEPETWSHVITVKLRVTNSNFKL